MALNGALHDTAIATWEVKLLQNSSRPITLIREMGSLGQSSDPSLSNYNVNGLPLEDGLVEVITAASSAPGQRHEHLSGHIGEIAILAWAGHPANPATEHGGVAWKLATQWIPYQQRSFVTPPFAGYTSGHSGFSRAGAEVLRAFTASQYFPGGLGEFVAEEGADFSLHFESGPSQPVRLQWASYYDASDEAGLSRIHGGIHPSYDDFSGRILGHEVGLIAVQRAFSLFGTPVGTAELPTLDLDHLLLLAAGLMLLAALASARRTGEG